jgi:uncharacterized protein
MRFPLFVRAFLLCAALFSQAALSADDDGNATATKSDENAQTPTAPEASKNGTAPEVVTFPIPEVEGDVKPEPVPIVVPAKPSRIALLLPLKSATFGRAAEAVKEGFLAASQVAGAEPSLPIEIYDSEEGSKNLLTIYDRILNDNARIVVGPMTRSEVTAIARSGMVTAPTLALNLPEGEFLSLPPRFYSLNLSQETEARQLARIAFTRGLRRAAIVTAATGLPKRIQAAFADEWLKLGATTTLEYIFNAETKSLSAFRTALKAQQVDVVFVAADATVARKIRPYIRSNLPTFATSQVFRSKNDAALNIDLKDLQFVDMPWLITPDHAAVMVYPQPKKSLTAELQRFYALGIDAYRIAQLLVRSDILPADPIDGVSGRITLTSGHWFTRELLPATFDQTGAVKSQNP